MQTKARGKSKTNIKGSRDKKSPFLFPLFSFQWGPFTGSTNRRKANANQFLPHLKSQSRDSPCTLKSIHRLKGVITPIIPSALKMLQPPFYLPSKVRIFWVIRFHPSHRWFSRLRNHFTVSLIIPLGDSVFLALISSNLINLIPGCKQHYSKVIFFASTHSKTVNIVICYESWKLSRALYFVHRWNLCKRRL